MAFKKVPAKNKQGYKWECVKDGPIDPATGKRNQIRRRADTKKAAEDAVDEVVRRLVDGVDEKEAKRMTFEEGAASWMDVYRRSGKKPSTVDRMMADIKFLCRFYGKAPIARISHKNHQDMLNELDNQGYALKTIITAHTTAGMIFKHAIKNKWRLDNPTKDAVIPRKIMTVEELENRSIEEKYLKVEELEEFLRAAIEFGEDGDPEAFYLLAFSGMRPGELLALKRPDFRFLERLLRISKTLYMPAAEKEYQLLTPKTASSFREFTIDLKVCLMLQSYIERRQEFFKRNPPVHDGGFIFCSDNGYPIYLARFTRRLNRLLKRTSIKKRVTPHIFRHTFISLLAEANVPLQTIMKRVGHDDAKTTLKIYTHVTSKMQIDADQKISEMYSDLLDIPFNNDFAENVIKK